MENHKQFFFLVHRKLGNIYVILKCMYSIAHDGYAVILKICFSVLWSIPFNWICFEKYLTCGRQAINFHLYNDCMYYVTSMKPET